MSSKYGVAVLAGGKGTRLKLDIPKPLAPFMGKTLIDYVLGPISDFLESANNDGKVGVVTGHKKELLEGYLLENYKDSFDFAFQEEQLGTADALKTYLEKCSWAKDCEYTVVMCADTPLMTPQVLFKMTKELEEKGLDGVAATFIEDNPFGYGRIKQSEVGFSIVEQKDATEEESKITEVNSGVYVVKTSYIKEHLYNINSENKSGEFYLTDLFHSGANVKAVLFEEKNFFLGVNDLVQLSKAERIYKKRVAEILMRQAGVIIRDPSHTSVTTFSIGSGTIIDPNVEIDQRSKIGSNVRIEQGVIIKNSVVEDGAHIKAYSYVTDSKVGPKASIGPFAHLRPGADIGEKAKIGNFVEIKKSSLDKGAKVSHLSYVGDAEIGEDVNIGCGFITCNYDGANKHKTIIGKGSFIGSDSQTIAPVNIGENCYVASASTVTHDMPDGAFAISRGRQVTKEGMAKKFIKKKK